MSLPGQEPVDVSRVRIVPANEATCEDLDAIFGTRDYPARCRCQRFKQPGWIWGSSSTPEQRYALHHAQAACGNPDAESTSGLIAFVDGEPAGWVAVEPRSEYLNLRHNKSPVVWRGRHEDKDDETVWSVTCFAVRKGFRGRGLTYHLAAATVEYARRNGARALEGYSMLTEPGKEITWGELHVGAHQVFEEAGFTEVSHPTKRRVVMRIDFDE
jgi:GNAT superfamily N-acetyltransferase